MYCISPVIVSLWCQEDGVDDASRTYQGATPTGSASLHMPDIRAVPTGEALRMRVDHDPACHRVRLPGFGLAVRGSVHPGTRTDIIAAFGREYGREDGRVKTETHVCLEEAFLSIGMPSWGLDRIMKMRAGREPSSTGREVGV